MRKIKTILLSCMMAFLLAASLLPSAVFAAEPISKDNSDTGYSLYIDDQADFLSSASDAEMDELIDVMYAITEYANVMIVTTTDHPYSDTEAFALTSLEDHYGYSNGIIFAIDRDLNQIYLLSEGNAQRKISDSRCDAITDNTYTYATQAGGYDYYTCCLATMNQVNAVLQGRRIAQPMRFVCSALLAFALGMLLCYIIARASSKPRKVSNSKLLFGIFSDVHFDNAKAELVNVTRTYSPPSSSGGGGGGHSGGGGGGHSGGGGGGGHSGGGHGI